MTSTDPKEIIKTFDDYAAFIKITDMTAKYVGKAREPVDGYFYQPYPQRLCALNESLKMWVLREMGDYKSFLALTKELNALKGREPSAKDKHVIAMAEWLDVEIDKLLPSYPEVNNPIVLGLMVWGGFTDKMLEILFRSWLAEGNINALCKNRHVIIHIITTKHDEEQIRLAETTLALKKLGTHFEYVNIPVEITKGSETYWLIGAGVALQLAYARRHNAAYHHAMPDFMYSNNFFSEIIRLSQEHDNILMGCLDTDEGVLKTWLEKYTKDGVISIAAQDLAAVMLNSVHIAEFFNIVNTRPEQGFIPGKHRLAWESHDTLHMCAPHLQPVYLSAKTISTLQDRFHISIDSELDLLIPAGVPFYVPQECDDLFICGMTNQSSRLPQSVYIQMMNFGQAIWDAIKMRDCAKFFFRGEVHKLNRSLRPQIAPMEKSQIKKEQEMLKGIMLASDPWVGKTLPKPREHDL